MPTKSVAQHILGDNFRSYEHWGSHPAVGLSSFCFALPAAMQVAYGLCLATAAETAPGRRRHLASYAGLAVMFTAVCITCALADYFYIRRGHRSWYGRLDIHVAFTSMLVASADFCCRHSWLETAVLDSFALAAFLFTALSPSASQWVVRHCIWHLVGGMLLVYGTASQPWEASALEGRLRPFLIWSVGAYVLVAALIVALCVCLPENLRKASWEWGARFAD